MVPDLRPPGAGRHDVPAGARRARGDADRCPGPGRRADAGVRSRRDYARYRQIGHCGSVQPASRLERDVVGADGTRYPKGTAVPQRADFNTLDNPVLLDGRPGARHVLRGAGAGLHFVVFNPSSDDFRRIRLAMDGVLPDGTSCVRAARARGQGFNSDPRDDAPSELPRAAAQSPLVPALGAPRLSTRVIGVDHARWRRDTPDLRGCATHPETSWDR